MALLRESREVKKVKAVLRAKFALQQRLDRIDHEEDIVTHTVEAILSGKGTVLGLLDASQAFNVVVDHENPTRPDKADACNGDSSRAAKTARPRKTAKGTRLRHRK
jgi:hypothetical protein